MKAGLVGFGFALPVGRVGLDVLAQSMGQDSDLFSGLGIKTRTFASNEENTFTLCARAGKNMFEKTTVDLKYVEYCILGSETPLYAVNPTSSMLAGVLGIPETAQMFDMEFACKSATAGMAMVCEIVKHKKEGVGVVFAGDIGSGEPGDALAYTAGSAGVGMIFGNSDEYPVLATVEHMTTLNRSRMDFWKQQGAQHPNHAGRWSGEVYAEIILASVRHFLDQAKKDIADFDHVVLHMPNGKLPARVAARLGVTKEQLKAGWIVEVVGNTYSACVPLALCNVLSVAKPGEDILVVSYGSGAGSDAFWLKVTEEIEDYDRPSVLEAVEKLPLIGLDDIYLNKK